MQQSLTAASHEIRPQKYNCAWKVNASFQIENFRKEKFISGELLLSGSNVRLHFVEKEKTVPSLHWAHKLKARMLALCNDIMQLPHNMTCILR